MVEYRDKAVAIFGYSDTLVGQILSFIELEALRFHVPFFITPSKPDQIDIESEHDKRPNRLTEFVREGRIFDRELVVEENYSDYLIDKKIDAAMILVESIQERIRIFRSLKRKGINVVTFIHPSAFLGKHATVAEGSIIFPGCYIGYKSEIGCCTIMQSKCHVEHHCRIGDFCNVSPGLSTGGFTAIEDKVQIFMSVSIVNRIRIGEGSTVGAGSLVLVDVPPKTLWYGAPARFVRRVNEPN